MGRKSVSVKCLRWLLDREDTDIVGVITDSHLPLSHTANLARAEGLSLFSFEEALALIRKGELKFDLGLSMLFWRKLTQVFLTVPRLGIINFHPAPLPDYKGTAGYNIAILEALSSWAATAHYMDEEIDTGGIIQIKEFPICPDSESVKSIEEKSQGVLFQLFVEVCTKAISAQRLLKVAPNTGGRYIDRKEMEQMKQIQTGDDIPRKIRAFWYPPYDGAYVLIEGKKYTLVNRSILSTLADPSTSYLFSKVVDEGG